MNNPNMNLAISDGPSLEAEIPLFVGQLEDRVETPRDYIAKMHTRIDV